MEKGLNNEDFQLWSVFNQASEAGIKIYDYELYRDLGISYIQMAVMYVIKNSKKALSPTELSRVLLREPHTTAALINRMVDNKLVVKTRDPHMKNIKRVSLTVRGEAIYSKAADSERYQLLKCLTPEERECLKVCSEKIRNEALNQITVRRLWQPLFGKVE